MIEKLIPREFEIQSPTSIFSPIASIKEKQSDFTKATLLLPKQTLPDRLSSSRYNMIAKEIMARHSKKPISNNLTKQYSSRTERPTSVMSPPAIDQEENSYMREDTNDLISRINKELSENFLKQKILQSEVSSTPDADELWPDPHIYRKDSLTKRAIRSMSFLVKSYFISQMKKSGDFVAQRKGQEIQQIISDSEIQEKGKVKRRSKGYSMKEFKSDSALFRQFVEEHLESFADELFDQYDCPMSTENKRILFSVVSHLIKGKSNFKKYINSGQKSKYNIGRRDSSKIFEAAKDFFAYNSRNSGLSSGRSFSLCSPVISLAKVLLERDEKNYDIVFKKLLGRKNMEVDDPEKLKRKVLETLDLTI